MKFKITSRHYLYTFISLFYIAPLVFFSAYSVSLLPKPQSWNILSIGLLLLAGSSLLIFLLLYYWEQTIKGENTDFNQEHTAPNLEEAHSPPIFYIEEKEQEINALKNQVARLASENSSCSEENNQLQQQLNQINQEFADYKIFSEDQIKQKNMQISALQMSLETQQGEIKHQQDHMEQLHTRVQDLSYEIKTLLSLNEKEPTSIATEIAIEQPYHPSVHSSLTSETQVRNDHDAVVLLRRCINTAQKITGAYYYGNELSRYREFSYSHSAIDLRRLFDSLRMENEAIIVVYSPKENKLLFANQQVKSALGWSPDKFAQDFHTLLPENGQEWKRVVSSLTTQTDAGLRIPVKTKIGQEIILQCYLGTIPTGLFRHYVVGVMFIPDPFS